MGGTRAGGGGGRRPSARARQVARNAVRLRQGIRAAAAAGLRVQGARRRGR